MQWGGKKTPTGFRIRMTWVQVPANLPALGTSPKLSELQYAHLQNGSILNDACVLSMSSTGGRRLGWAHPQPQALSNPADLEEAPLRPLPLLQGSRHCTQGCYLKCCSFLDPQAPLAPVPAGKEGGGPGSREGSGREERSLVGGEKRRNSELCGLFFPSANRGGDVCPVFPSRPS